MSYFPEPSATPTLEELRHSVGDVLRTSLSDSQLTQVLLSRVNGTDPKQIIAAALSVAREQTDEIVELKAEIGAQADEIDELKDELDYVEQRNERLRDELKDLRKLVAKTTGST